MTSTLNKNFGPTLPLSKEIHAQKYRSEGESFREAMNRVAGALADDMEHFYAFRNILLDMRFLPGGRVQAAMGSTKNVTPYNCYVSGTIEDSFTDGDGHIMQRATEAATTMRMGGGIGYDFSTLRPRGALIRKLDSFSSGPVAFMGIFDAICKTIACSGHRRGAQMGVLRVDHPDIEEFIRAKQNSDKLTGFNISVGVTDEFMLAVRHDTTFDLQWGGEVYKTIKARPLWDMIMRSTWDWAEPGVLFIDRINDANNLWYCEAIAATNPCGEQPLPPHGACLLGSFNLTKYIVGSDIEERRFDWDRLAEDIPDVVRAMDNVVDRAVYPLPEQEVEAKSKRRMGLGITGLANAIEALGYPYGSEPFLILQERIMRFLRDRVYAASVGLAKEKGPFPLFHVEHYCQGEFIKSLPQQLQEDIREHGIRNSHLLSIAPTGTISLAADNVSSGIEPVFSYWYDRTIMDFNGQRTERVEDYGYRVWGVKGKRTHEVTLEEHLKVLALAQQYVDSAVSKTCNVGDEVTWEQFKEAYMEAWLTNCKGCTTFRATGKRGAILVANDEAEPTEDVKATEESVAAACYIDPVTGKRECE